MRVVIAKPCVTGNLVAENQGARNIFVCVMLILLMLPACSFIEPHAPEIQRAEKPHYSPAESLEQAQKYWWRASMKMRWDERQDTAWHMDTLLAHQIFKPLLLQHSNEIEMWRFHRRAARDAAGHRFSFIFYALPDTAAAIFQSLENNALLRELLESQLVESVKTDDIQTNRQSAIEATSDKNWSLPLQRAWPYFGMGVSQLW